MIITYKNKPCLVLEELEHNHPNVRLKKFWDVIFENRNHIMAEDVSGNLFISLVNKPTYFLKIK